LDFWTQILLTMALLNFMLNIRAVLFGHWINNHVRHIEFHVCPDHEEWEEVRERLHDALESHLRGAVEEQKLDKGQLTIEEWDNQ
jgi:hypothetical protein